MSTTETPTALAGLVGEWEGTVRTWFEPGQLADESPIRARIRSLVPQDEEHPGGGFVLYEYSGTMQGQPCEGVAIVGWDETKGQQAVSAWVDSFHMSQAIMLSRAPSGAAPGPSTSWGTTPIRRGGRTGAGAPSSASRAPTTCW
ncbi:MAG TPA: DUF1579 family protein [Chloroflexota bacterium]|jgi:hypothetical protein|nr:DUF1579 family protein [Chloroflexota bacterium]HEX2517752.1 DUF1579 family protein [Chloroflexota bacterium]